MRDTPGPKDAPEKTPEERQLTEYERYIRTEALLSLQKAPADLSCHDEMAFQMVHQVEELWMKLALHELDRAQGLMHQDNFPEASRTLRRVHIILTLMANQMRILETMSPKAYFTVRQVLGRGSGQESPGFNAMLDEGPRMRETLKGLLERSGVSLLEIHRDPEAHPALFDLTEALLDVDDGFQQFRARHLALVRRIIGGRTPSLKGAPADLLEVGVKACFFPELWLVREALFRDFVPGPSLDDGGFDGH
ncbi:MAG: tryptophan 2,3-dioxygenase family protein [Bradymonadia bacterium]